MGCVLMPLKYPGRCSLCQTSKKAGTKAYWDDEARKIICTKCKKLQERGLEPVVQASPAQDLIDRARRLIHTPATADELKEIIQQLKSEHAGDRAAMQFLTEYHNLRHHETLIVMPLKYDGRCVNCEKRLLKDTAAAWDKHEHRIWCLDCACP